MSNGKGISIDGSGEVEIKSSNFNINLSGDFKCVLGDSGLVVQVEGDHHESSLFIVLVFDIKDPVIPVTGVSSNEGSPFEVNSFLFSLNGDFKVNFEFSDSDLEFEVDRGSVSGDRGFVIDVNDVNFSGQFNVNFSSVDFDVVGEVNINFEDDAGKVSFKFDLSSFNSSINFNFEISDDLDLVV